MIVFFVQHPLKLNSAPKICLMVLSCVALSLVDVVGVIHFWGLTIDTISCISVVLVVGLCIDYSAHIGHAYIVSTVRVIYQFMYSVQLKGEV